MKKSRCIQNVCVFLDLDIQKISIPKNRQIFKSEGNTINNYLNLWYLDEGDMEVVEVVVVTPYSSSLSEFDSVEFLVSVSIPEYEVMNSDIVENYNDCLQLDDSRIELKYEGIYFVFIVS